MPRPPANATGVRVGGTRGGTSTLSSVQLEGPHVVVPIAIEDVGYLHDQFDKGPQPRISRSVVVHIALDVEGKVMVVKEPLYLSWDDRATLMKMVVAARGGKALSKDEAVDISEIVGKPFVMTIKSRETNKRDGWFVNARAPTALIAGTPIPASLQAIVEKHAREPYSVEFIDEERLEEIRAALIARVWRDAPAAATTAPPAPSQPSPPTSAPPARPAPAQQAEGRPDFLSVSEISLEKWDEAAPIIRAFTDQWFKGEVRVLTAWFHDPNAINPQNEYGIAVRRFFGINGKGRDAKPVVHFGGRTDGDVDKLLEAIAYFNDLWRKPDSGMGVEVDDNDALPF